MRPAAAFERVAGRRVDVRVLGGRRARMQLRVVAGRDADEHAGRAAGEPVGAMAGVLERLPGDLEQQPLLRVHRRRLARRDAEELRIERDRPATGTRRAA